jgi:hypothetical protein
MKTSGSRQNKNKSNAVSNFIAQQAKRLPASQAAKNHFKDVSTPKKSVATAYSPILQLTACQLTANDVTAARQSKAFTPPAHTPIKANATGLPDKLKAGAESLSGFNLDDVRVHYNSGSPAQLMAHAYAQGNHIHVAPGQETHLPHEAWHVVQQKQGRVKATVQLKSGISVNDDVELEREADTMGAEALKPKSLYDGRKGQASDNNEQQTPKGAECPIQRVISYKKGQYKDREDLIQSLYAIFDRNARKEIDGRVEAYEDSPHSFFGNQARNLIIEDLKGKGYVPNFGNASSSSSSSHGPMLPDQVDRFAKPDSAAALETFNFPSVTLGRLTLLSNGGHISFQDRQIDANFHAEDGLLEQMNTYISQNKIIAAETAVNLTINNFFCSSKTTKKSKPCQNCLDQIIQLQQKYRFARFHVYFQNTYGKAEIMGDAIKALQAAGILVTAITTTEDAPYHHKLLDPESDSEHEEHDDRDEQMGTTSSGLMPKKKSQFAIDEEENAYLEQLLHVNNCLINAIARAGLDRNANFAELVTLRVAMRQRGFHIGDMLVASPAILTIILNVLGINRGVRVIYQDSNHPNDEAAGPDTIIIDHRNDHFQERRFVRPRAAKNKQAMQE